ncbi:MAG: hypothetical protein AAF799_14130 [Myxococcota bacterium]
MHAQQIPQGAPPPVGVPVPQPRVQPSPGQPVSPPTAGSAPVAAAPPNAATGASDEESAAGCPHDYPVSAAEDGFFAALGLSFKVLPYALFRLAHWSMYTAISITMVVASLGLGTWLTVSVNKWAGIVLILGTLVPIVMFWLPFVERKTFGAKCAHIAILTELITKGHVGDGKQSAFAYAKQLVQTRFTDLTSLWDVNRSVNRTLKQLTRTLNFIDKWLPIDISAIKRGIHALVNGASRYLDAVILSYGLARGDQDFASPAIDGVTYCAQNSGKMFRTAIGVIVLEKLMLVPLYLVVGLGAIGGVFAATFSAMGGTLASLQTDAVGVVKADPIPFLIALAVGLVVGGLIAMMMVRTVRESFIEPTLITMVMLRFHKIVKGQPLDASWKQKLQDAGDGIGRLASLRHRVERAI